MELAAVVSLFAAQNKDVVPVMQKAPNNTAGFTANLCFIFFKYIANTITDIKLLAPLIANGDQDTILIHNPPKLNRAAATRTNIIPSEFLFCIFISISLLLLSILGKNDVHIISQKRKDGEKFLRPVSIS